MGISQGKLSRVELNEVDLSALMAATEMSKSEIIKWHKGFLADCPSGRISRNELIKIYEQLFPSGRAKRFCDLVFKIFDKKNTNTIGFNEFIITCSLTARLGRHHRHRISLKPIESKGYMNREALIRIVDGVQMLYEGAPLNKTHTSQQPES